MVKLVLSKEQKEEICNIYSSSNKGVTYLAELFHVGKVKIKNVLTEFGIEMKSAGKQGVKSNIKNKDVINNIGGRKKKTTEEFISEAKVVWGDKYNYSKVNYVNAKTKVLIICNACGREFEQLPNSHIDGHGCNCQSIFCNDYTTETWIDSAKKIHGDKYDYTKSNYINANTPIILTCKEHGDFTQRPSSHLKGHGCKLCGDKSRKEKEQLNNLNSRFSNFIQIYMEALTHNEFIKRANILHNNKYDYSLVEFKTQTDYIDIICPIHGKFRQTVRKHLMGRGCQQCGAIKRAITRTTPTKEFIKKANKIHKGKYKYEKVDTYNKINGKVTITCPKHGDFDMTISHHLEGQGCPSCKFEKLAEINTKTQSKFIDDSIKIHGSLYNYDNSKYYGAKKPVEIICPTHGIFWQTPDAHINGKQGCPKCGKIISNEEIELTDYITEIVGDDIILHSRDIISPYELDIFIPSKNIAIEYNGNIWHTEWFAKRDRTYHLNKLNLCNEKGIKLIQIFSDEWVYHKDIVLSKINHILSNDKETIKVPGRKCIVKCIDKDSAFNFLEKNHIQSFASASLYYGAFFNNELIGVMTFLKEKDGYWNLNRFASKNGYLCQGVAGKLFKYFIRTEDPLEIKSFADRRWTLNGENNLYTKLNFNLDKILPPDYRYFNSKVDRDERFHKFAFRKNKLLKKYNFSTDLTEREMMTILGYDRIWDCGLFRYIWKKGE